jgi:ubiquinone/menaquinone biosynthesis C-methylase UbiE
MMIEVARRVAPEIEWREGSATALPLADGEAFDVVLCQQGLQFFDDRLAALREMRRAIVPDGSIAVSTWRGLDVIALIRAIHEVAVRWLGPIDPEPHPKKLSDKN